MPLYPFLCAIIGLYVIVRVALPSRLSWPLKIVVSILLFACAEKLYLTRLYYGSLTAYSMSVPVAIVTGILNAFVIMLFLLALLRDIYWLLRFLLRRKRSRSSKPGQTGLVATAAFLAVFSVWSALKVPAVSEVTLSIPNLPPALTGLRIVQLSDLHIGPIFKERWLSDVVREVNRLHPDIIAITGDLSDGHPSSQGKNLTPLKDLKARYGTYIVLGNHDYYASAPQWLTFLRNLGLTVLTNEHVSLEITDSGQTARFTVAGVTDPAAQRARMETPNVQKALEGSSGIRLLLAHNPVLAKGSASAGADIQLSGHTHGGQILPMAPLVAQFNQGYSFGTYTVGDMQLYVSRGTGLWSGVPIRLLCPSEITLLTLQPESPKK